jgi:hypothetical protein
MLSLTTGCGNPEYPTASFPLGETENNRELLDVSPTEPSGIDFSAAHPGASLRL